MIIIVLYLMHKTSVQKTTDFWWSKKEFIKKDLLSLKYTVLGIWIKFMDECGNQEKL